MCVLTLGYPQVQYLSDNLVSSSWKYPIKRVSERYNTIMLTVLNIDKFISKRPKVIFLLPCPLCPTVIFKKILNMVSRTAKM